MEIAIKFCKQDFDSSLMILNAPHSRVTYKEIVIVAT